MKADLIFEWSPSNVVYITSSPEKPYENRLDLDVLNLTEESGVTFQNEYGLTVHDELPRLNETRERPEWNALSRIYLQFYWGTGEGCLCSKELGQAIAASWIEGEQRWDIKFMAEGYFILIPSATAVLEKTYSISFSLENLLCDSVSGLTAAKIYTQNLPGYEDGAASLSIRKVKPVEIRSFTADRRLVQEGGKTVLSWCVRYGDACVLEGFGEVEPEGCREVAVERSTEFILTASNRFGQKQRAAVTVEASRGVWKEEAAQMPFGLPERDTASAWNQELIPAGGGLYACVNSVMYYSPDGLQFSLAASEAGRWTGYGIGGGEGEVCLLGRDSEWEQGAFVRYLLEKRTWEVWKFPFRQGGRTAVCKTEGCVWAAVQDGSGGECAVYQRDCFPEGSWRLLTVVPGPDIRAFKLAAYRGLVCLAVRRGQSISIYGTESGGPWDWSYEIREKAGGDLWLMACGEGVFLMTQAGIYGKRDSGGFVRETVLPEELSWPETMPPFVGMFQNAVWSIGSISETRRIWSYTVS